MLLYSQSAVLPVHFRFEYTVRFRNRTDICTKFCLNFLSNVATMVTHIIFINSQLVKIKK